MWSWLKNLFKKKKDVSVINNVITLKTDVAPKKEEEKRNHLHGIYLL